MSLVSDLLQQAFLDLDEIRVGRLIAPLEQAESFARLNQLLSQWSTEQLSVFTIVHQGLTLTAGTADYTLGTGGTLVTTSRPVRVTGALSVSGAFRSPVEVMGFDAFDADPRVVNGRGKATVLAKLLAADQAYPSLALRVHPTPAPAPGTLFIDYWTALAAFATVGDTIALPPGYEKALRWNLALDLYPTFCRHPRPGALETIAGMAQASKASIVALNAAVLGSSAPPAAAPPAQQAAQ